MSIWVVAADASRARFFQTQSSRGPLEELQDLVHPGSRLAEHELVSDRPGAGRGRPQGGGVGHSVGHEQDAVDEERERFARDVAAALREARERGRCQRLHLLAAPRFLGSLRAHLDAATRECVVSEHAVDVTTETPDQLRARLPERL